MNDLPASLTDLGGSRRRHRAGRGKHGNGAWIRAMYFGRRRNEGALLHLRPGNVVDGKSRDNITVTGDVDWLPAKRDE